MAENATEAAVRGQIVTAIEGVADTGIVLGAGVQGPVPQYSTSYLKSTAQPTVNGWAVRFRGLRQMRQTSGRTRNVVFLYLVYAIRQVAGNNQAETDAGYTDFVGTVTNVSEVLAGLSFTGDASGARVTEEGVTFDNADDYIEADEGFHKFPCYYAPGEMAVMVAYAC